MKFLLNYLGEGSEAALMRVYVLEHIVTLYNITAKWVIIL